MRRDAFGPSRRKAAAVVSRKRQRKRAHDLLQHLVLQAEDVVELAVVALGPKVAAGGRVDQLRVDAHLLAGLAHAALQHVSDTERLADLADIDLAPLVAGRRGSRNDRQAGNLGQVGDQVLGHAVREILLLGVAAHVDEGQDGDRCLRRLRRGNDGWGGRGRRRSGGRRSGFGRGGGSRSRCGRGGGLHPPPADGANGKRDPDQERGSG